MDNNASITILMKALSLLEKSYLLDVNDVKETINNLFQSPSLYYLSYPLSFYLAKNSNYFGGLAADYIHALVSNPRFMQCLLVVMVDEGTKEERNKL